MEKECVRHVLRRFHELEKERRTWEAQWQEISRVMLPAKGKWSEESHNKGWKKHGAIVDSTALYALRILAAGMHGGLSSPARPWFRFALKDKALENAEGVGKWLQDTQERVHAVLSGSNFYPTVHAHYAELAAFGTACFLIEEDSDEVIRCSNLTVGEYYLDCDARGRVDTLYRTVSMTARQIAERFADYPDIIRENAEKDSLQAFTVIHAIEPRAEYDPRKIGAKNRRFASYYVLQGQGSFLLEEDGYEEFPACCPRWDVTGQDVYGRGPGMDALPDVNMLQRMRQDGLEALELEIKPPMNVSNSLRSQGGQFSLRPGYANFVDANTQGPAITPTYQIQANLQALDAYLQQIRQQIGEHFYKDLFLLLSRSDKRMTAAEVYERNAEKLLMLGPTLERLRSELFQPLIQRVLGIMKRNGKILPVPDILKGREWEIEMQSSLALAQKSSDISAIENIMAFAGSMARVNPDVLDNLDMDEMLVHNAKLLGVPLSLLRGKDKVALMREARRQEQAKIMQEQKAWEMLEKGVSTAKSLSEVDLQGKNMASALFADMQKGTGGSVPSDTAQAQSADNPDMPQEREKRPQGKYADKTAQA